MNFSLSENFEREHPVGDGDDESSQSQTEIKTKNDVALKLDSVQVFRKKLGRLVTRLLCNGHCSDRLRLSFMTTSAAICNDTTTLVCFNNAAVM